MISLEREEEKQRERERERERETDKKIERETWAIVVVTSQIFW